jgi:hypothetical protein
MMLKNYFLLSSTVCYVCLLCGSICFILLQPKVNIASFLLYYIVTC